MAQLITEIWVGLRSAGLPEVMLYLDDGSASRCHWNDTTMIGEVRVALLADQDRQIVRILPVESCAGIGIASPKGVDSSGYKTIVHGKLRSTFGGDEVAVEVKVHEEDGHGQAHQPVAESAHAAAPAPVPASAEAPTPEAVVASLPPSAPAPVSKSDPLNNRWGVATRSAAGAGASGAGRPGITPYGSR